MALSVIARPYDELLSWVQYYEDGEDWEHWRQMQQLVQTANGRVSNTRRSFAYPLQHGSRPLYSRCVLFVACGPGSAPETASCVHLLRNC